jgi:hypothetical protein
MPMQKTIWDSWEIYYTSRIDGEDRTVVTFEGTEQECLDHIKTCELNKEGD